MKSQYATREDYANYLAGDTPVLPEQSLNRYLRDSSTYINYITMGRITDQDLTDCCCELAEFSYITSSIAEFSAIDDKPTGEIVSESVGGYTVSYDRSGKTAKKRQLSSLTVEQQKYNIICKYLAYTGLLSRRVGLSCE